LKYVRPVNLGRTIYTIYSSAHLVTAAAALSYYLTFSLFPLLFCLYCMLGELFPTEPELRVFLSGVLPTGVIEEILRYLSYIPEYSSTAAMLASAVLLAGASSAGFRTVSRTMALMRQRRRKTGLRAFLQSLAFSVFFLAAFYLSVIFLVTGKWFLDFADRYVLFLNISGLWKSWRYVLMYLLMFAMLSGVYRFTNEIEEQEALYVLPGAVFGAGALVAASMIFSALIDRNSSYPLVYGSIASIMIVLLWFYTCSLIMFLGNAFNVALERNCPPQRN